MLTGGASGDLGLRITAQGCLENGQWLQARRATPCHMMSDVHISCAKLPEEAYARQVPLARTLAEAFDEEAHGGGRTGRHGNTKLFTHQSRRKVLRRVTYWKTKALALSINTAVPSGNPKKLRSPEQ